MVPGVVTQRNKTDNLLAKPREMGFNSSNLAARWKKWRQNMEFYLTAMMRGKTEEEKYSVFLFLIGEHGKDIFNTIEWDKKVDAQENQTEEDDIMVKLISSKDLKNTACHGGGKKKILLEVSA